MHVFCYSIVFLHSARLPLLLLSQNGILLVNITRMKWFKNFFSRKQEAEPQSLRIQGVGQAPMTPEPDDAELAAAALLEHVRDVRSKREHTHKAESNDRQQADIHDAKYYERLAAKIRQAHDESMLRTLRFVSFCEQELRKDNLPLTGAGSLALLETELLKRIDTIEREDGKLKRRWQHCLAEVTIRMMDASNTDTADTATYQPKNK